MNSTLLALIAGVCLGLAVLAFVVVIALTKYRHKWMVRTAALVLGALVFLSLALTSRSVSQEAYTRCTNRNVNIVIANHFYREMSRLESSNRFIDGKLRAERVALYNSVVYPLADCSPRP